MYIRTHIMMRSLSAAAIAVAGLGAPAWAGDKDLELEEQAAALKGALKRISSLEEQLKDEGSKNSALAESLAASNREAREWMAQYKKVRLELESYGVSLLEKEDGGIEQRLLAAVSDLQNIDDENQKLREQLVKLSEAVIAFKGIAVSPDGESRAKLEAALREADSALGIGAEKRGSRIPLIEDAKVVSYKSDHGLAVINAGELSGMRVGMPLKIVRGKQAIATALVVDVREKISGAVVTQTLARNSKVKVQDGIRLEAIKADDEN